MIGQDPYGDMLNGLKPEFMVVKCFDGTYDLRLFDPTVNRSYSAKLEDKGEGYEVMVRLATQKLIEAWVKDLGLPVVKSVEVVKV